MCGRTGRDGWTTPITTSRRRRTGSSRRYARQGLYRGTLDEVVEALIVDSGSSARCASFGEFRRDWKREGTALHARRDELWNLLRGFHPARKPVLWRVLVAQYLL